MREELEEKYGEKLKKAKESMRLVQAAKAVVIELANACSLGTLGEFSAWCDQLREAIYTLDRLGIAPAAPLSLADSVKLESLESCDLDEDINADEHAVEAPTPELAPVPLAEALPPAAEPKTLDAFGEPPHVYELRKQLAEALKEAAEYHTNFYSLKESKQTCSEHTKNNKSSEEWLQHLKELRFLDDFLRNWYECWGPTGDETGQETPTEFAKLESVEGYLRQAYDFDTFYPLKSIRSKKKRAGALRDWLIKQIAESKFELLGYVVTEWQNIEEEKFDEDGKRIRVPPTKLGFSIRRCYEA